jgi:hypothetical protein
MSYISGFRGFSAAALVAGAGLFATLTPDLASAASCSASDITTDIGISSLSCVDNVPGGPGGNVKEAQMNANAVSGKTGWMDLGKINTPGTSGGVLEITGAGQSGTWKLSDGNSFDPLAFYSLALKAGRANVVYLLDTSDTSGTWSTAGLMNRGGQQPALSNITLFGTSTSPSQVPLPAAAWLLIGGIGALGAASRKRQANVNARS